MSCCNPERSEASKPQWNAAKAEAPGKSLTVAEINSDSPKIDRCAHAYLLWKRFDSFGKYLACPIRAIE